MNTNHQKNTQPSGLIRLFSLPEVLVVSLPTIHRWIKAGALPQPIKLSARVTAFRVQDIQDFINTRQGGI